MSSDATSNQLKTVIARLLAYQNDAGQQLSTYIAARVYVSQAPDDTSGTYLVVRKINTELDPEVGNLREEFDIEITGYGRPRSKEQEVELVVDLAEEALITWKESSPALGLSYGRYANRDTEEPDPDPEDRDLVKVRTLVRCASWAKRLSNALT